MSPEASQIQRGIRRQHWDRARDVQPTILTLGLRVDHVFAVLYWNAATACRTLARREGRFSPLDRFANVLSTSKLERHLLPPHGRPREGDREGLQPMLGWSKWGGVAGCSQRVTR